MSLRSQLPDLMVQIEELRQAARGASPDQLAAISRKRAALRDLLIQQRAAEHDEDMRYARDIAYGQAVPNTCNFAPLDPMPHRRNYVPVRRSSWVTPAAGYGVLIACGALALLQYFGVLVP